MPPLFVFFTGASGAGKTTTLKNLEKYISGKENVFLHYDLEGIPSEAEMVKQFGSIEAWQEQTTYKWIESFKDKFINKKHVFLDRQNDINFIINGFKKTDIDNYKIILFHCEKSVRDQRLIEERGQPELANENMDNWAEYLFKQAKELHIPILATSNISEDRAVREILKICCVSQ